jgi:hypothetical protein
MSPEPPPPPSRKRLALWTLLALAGASVVTVLLVLPAEYAVDPTGFGRVSGLTRMGAGKEVEVSPPKGGGAVTIASAQPWRTDVITIQLAPGGQTGADTERKVWMVPGQAFVYAWSADGEVYSDFHGETLPSPQIRVMTYRRTDPLKGDPATALNGSFTAPMEGFHGWYFNNLEARPVTVTVRLAGFYETRPYPPPTGVAPQGH